MDRTAAIRISALHCRRDDSEGRSIISCREGGIVRERPACQYIGDRGGYNNHGAAFIEEENGLLAIYILCSYSNGKWNASIPVH